MDAVPRLLIVDAGDSLNAIVRSIFDLSGRRCRIVTASTALDAFDELGVRVPDLLLTADRLNGEHRGTELVSRAREALPDLPIILVAEESITDLPDLPNTALLSRPLPPNDLWRAIRLALGEPDDAPPPVLAEVEDIGAIPPINPAQLQPILVRLVGEVGAVTGALADRTGLLLLSAGAPAYLNLPQIAALIRPTAMSTVQLTPILGDRLRTLHYFDGARHDVFSLGVGLHHFVFLVFDSATGERALGGVRRYGNAAIDEMIRSLGSAALQLPTIASTRPAVRVSTGPAPAAPVSEMRVRRSPDPVRPTAPPDPALLIADLDLSVFDNGHQPADVTDDPFAPDRIESLISGIGSDGDELIYQSSL